MNLILFDAAEVDRPLARTDERAKHILEVLRREIGDDFDVGLTNGLKGQARLVDITPDALAASLTYPAAFVPQLRWRCSYRRPVDVPQRLWAGPLAAPPPSPNFGESGRLLPLC